MKRIALTIGVLFLPLITAAAPQCGDFAFDTPRVLDGPIEPTPFLADFDGDGLLDVGLAGYPSFDIAFGRGGGRLSRPVTVADMQIPFVVADVTGSALPDLVLPGVAVRENLGGGRFAPPVQLGAGVGVVASGDFTNDGRTDLLLQQGGTSSANPQFLLVVGGSDLTPHAVEVPYQSGYSLNFAVGDLDDDGNADLVSHSSTNATALVIFGDGHGNFPRAAVVSIPAAASQHVVADFDHDGRDDLGLLLVSSELAIVFGGGSETMRTQLVPTGTISVAEINGDGVPDIIATGNGIHHLYVNDGHGHFTHTEQFGFRAFELGDLTGDGLPDIVAGVTFGFIVVPGRGNGTFDAEQHDLENAILAGHGDVDGDGDDELVLKTAAGALVVASPGSPVEPLPVTGTAPTQVSIARNGEILVPQTNALTVFRRGADGPWSATRTLSRQTRGSLLADLDGNGANEIVIAESESGGTWVKILDDTTDAELYRIAVTQRPGYHFAVGDANEDGHQDLFAGVSGSFASIPHSFVLPDGELDLWLGNGDGTFGERRTLLTNESFQQPYLGDFNGDDHVDVALMTGSDYRYLLYVIAGDGTGAFRSQQPLPRIPIDDEWAYALDVADVNGDGLDDLTTSVEDMLVLYLGTPEGLFRRSRWWSTSWFSDALALARLQPNAPYSAILGRSFEDEPVVFALEGICLPLRGRGVRH